MRKYPVLFLIAAAASALFREEFYLPHASEPRSSSRKVIGGEMLTRVIRVIDGDTIEIENGERVRYIGMDAPETVDPRKPLQCFGAEASAKNRELVGGKAVLLKKDVSDRDAYGRLLRYVYLVDGYFVNLDLVKEGYARALAFPPDVEYANEFSSAEEAARQDNLGLWNARCAKY